MPPTEERSRRWLILGILMFAVLLRIGLGLRIYHRVDQVEVDNVAESFAQGRGLADPYGGPILTGPTALYSPLYVAMKGMVFTLFTREIERVRAMIVLTSIFMGFICIFWILFGAGLRIPYPIALFCAVLQSVLLIQPWLEIKGATDNVPLALSGMCLVATFDRLMQKQLKTCNAALFGLIGGIATLLSASALAFVAGLVFAGLIRAFRGGFLIRYVRYCIIVGLVLLAVQIPWASRNYGALGRAVLLRDNLGLELWVANNPKAVALQDEDQKTGFVYAQHPYVTQSGFAEYARVGELAYFDRCYRKAISWIRDNPLHFLRLTIARIGYFWFPILSSTVLTGVRWIVSAGAFIGFAIAFRLRRSIALEVGCLCLFYSIPYYFVSATARYSYPIYPFQVLFCSWAILESIKYFRLTPAFRRFFSATLFGKGSTRPLQYQ